MPKGARPLRTVGAGPPRLPGWSRGVYSLASGLITVFLRGEMQEHSCSICPESWTSSFVLRKAVSCKGERNQHGNNGET